MNISESKKEEKLSQSEHELKIKMSTNQLKRETYHTTIYK